VTVAEYLRDWLGHPPKQGEPIPPPPPGLSVKTCSRYRELCEGQILPHLGAISLQKLRPAQIADWHETLLKVGSKKGAPLAARTVGHAHRVLHRALERAVATETLSRNVAAAIPPPKIDPQSDEIEILDEVQLSHVLHALQGHSLEPIVALDLATGLRRGELLALRLSDVDLDGGSVRVERSLEETKAGLRFKSPKTKSGRRTISIPATTVAMLGGHRRKLLELRLALGLGKPDADALLFPLNPEGEPIPPNRLTRRWQDACKSRKLPRVSFHALRHTHASALIAGGVDVVAIARRLGHANPTVTLRIYAHLFKKDDSAAVAAIEAALAPQKGR
jgi:integrase